MISLRKQGEKKIGKGFKSYAQIGAYLVEHGETGIYWAINQKGQNLLTAMKKIKVKKYWVDDEDGARWEREIEMEGSYY